MASSIGEHVETFTVAKGVQASDAANQKGGGIQLKGDFSMYLEFAVTGSVTLERSWDDGDTYEPIQTYTEGSAEKDLNALGFEPQNNVLYRFNCTAVGGNIDYRLSR